MSAGTERDRERELDALAGRLEALRALNVELEERIAARTRELGAVNARLETVVQELPVGVIVLGSEGSIDLANPPALEILGVAREDLADLAERQPWQMFTRDGRALPLHERPMVRALGERTATTRERFEIERPDGRRIVVELSAVPFREPGGMDSVVVTIEDVTERETLERAERDFVTNAAHELQTPLAAIISAVDVLQAGAKERPEDRDRFLQHIADASARLEQLTRALLLLARAEIGDRVRTEVVALAPLLESIAASSAREREVRVECDADLGVIGNGTLLGQALANLVDNATKHTRAAVVIAAEPEADRVRIAVRDQGDGIPEADRERVLERFYRGEGVTQEGSGLGLAIVAAVSRALGGELELESSQAGTTVSIVLPAARLVSR